MTVEQAQASSIEVNKTPSRQRTAVASASKFRFGIKAKLFLAFFSLAASTALAMRLPGTFPAIFIGGHTYHGRKRSRHSYRP